MLRQFTGKERDSESGLDYFGARYYGSALGRWTSPDWSASRAPVPYASFGDPQSLNLYGYVRNNPLGKADADGHDGFGDALVAVGKEIYNQTIAPLLNLASATSKLPQAAMGQDTGATFHGELAPANGSQAETMAAVAPALTMATMLVGEGEAAESAGIAARVQEIHGVLGAGTQTRVTTAVGEAIGADGSVTRLVGSSEGTLRPAQRAALQPGEIAVRGQRGTHAEVNVLNAAKQNGQTLTSEAPSRPACANCAATMKANDVKVVNP